MKRLLNTKNGRYFYGTPSKPALKASSIFVTIEQKTELIFYQLGEETLGEYPLEHLNTVPHNTFAAVKYESVPDNFLYVNSLQKLSQY